MKRAEAAAAVLVLGVAVSACGPVEVRLDQTRGVPAVKGSTQVQLGSSFICGTPISSPPYTVTTKAVAGGGCELSFDQDVEVLKSSDYGSMPELKGATNFVQRIELLVKKLSFSNSLTGATLDLATHITSATLAINGQQVVDKSSMARLPAVATLDGEALSAVKVKVEARQSVSLRATCVVVVPSSPAPPEKITIDYDTQPTIILGPGKVL